MGFNTKEDTSSLINNQISERSRSTIGIKNITKNKLDKNRAPGQSYDGFICQLVSLWEKTNGNR